MLSQPSFYAQPHAEEVCRRSGAWSARRAGKIMVLLSRLIRYIVLFVYSEVQIILYYILGLHSDSSREAIIEVNMVR